MGLSGDQNNTRGGFSGAHISIQSVPGSNYSFRNQTGYGTAPELQWTDESADSTAQKSTTLRSGGSGRGPIAMDKAFWGRDCRAEHRWKEVISGTRYPQVTSGR